MGWSDECQHIKIMSMLRRRRMCDWLEGGGRLLKGASRLHFVDADNIVDGECQWLCVSQHRKPADRI